MASNTLTAAPAERILARALLSLRIDDARSLWPPDALSNAVDLLVDDCHQTKLPTEAVNALLGCTRRAAEGIWPGELEIK